MRTRRYWDRTMIAQTVDSSGMLTCVGIQPQSHISVLARQPVIPPRKLAAASASIKRRMASLPFVKHLGIHSSRISLLD